MLPNDYSEEDFERDFNYLLENGLIEVAGINDEGQWLYGATKKGRQVVQSIKESGFLDILYNQPELDE